MADDSEYLKSVWTFANQRIRPRTVLERFQQDETKVAARSGLAVKFFALFSDGVN
jgi:hypothetical protein